MNQNKKIAVTIITGFLGAGKTTFINSLLTANQEKQFALVENEFGEVSIDSKLIRGVDASQMFELKEGCICCTISDEYELVLAELAERFPNVDHLLIETTGVADPASVIRPFFDDENLQKIYALNGTICMVDALNFNDGIEKELKHKQIAIADRILISKAEHLSDLEKSDILESIKKINSLSEIQFTKPNAIEQFRLVELTFSLKYFQDFRIENSGIISRLITFTEPINREKFTHWLSYTLDVYKNEIYRIKGILCFENEPYEFVLQGLGGSFEIQEGENWISSTKSEIVVIGLLENLDLKETF